MVVFLMVFSAIMFFAPEMGGYFLEYNNFVPADPLQDPGRTSRRCGTSRRSIRCCARFRRLLGSQFPGVLVMGLAVLMFFLLPWLDRSPVKSIRYQGAVYKTALALFVISFLVLGCLGTVPTDVWGRFGGWLGGAERATVVARIFTVVYFAVLPADALVHQDRQDQAGA